jgi:hypothetical protein
LSTCVEREYAVSVSIVKYNRKKKIIGYTIDERKYLQGAIGVVQAHDVRQLAATAVKPAGNYQPQNHHRST